MYQEIEVLESVGGRDGGKSSLMYAHHARYLVCGLLALP